MLHIGTIADLPTLPGIPGYFGSEIVLTSGDAQQRSISRETRLIPIHANDPSTQAFLELGEVSSLLLEQVNIVVVDDRPATAEVGFNEDEACPTSLVYNSPVAQQCCYNYQSQPSFIYMKSSTKSNDVVIRWSGYSSGHPCSTLTKGEYLQNCYGSDCTFGPLGFETAEIVSGTSSDNIYTNAGACDYGTGASGFKNVTGLYSQVAGQSNTVGCCGTSYGPCGLPGTPACSTCGGGDNAPWWGY
jgi:hypothetical protein